MRSEANPNATALPPSALFSFAGKNVLITGATRGIGRAIAEAFLTAGAQVIGTYLSGKKEAAAFEADARKNNWPLSLFSFDVSDYEAVEKFYGEFESQFENLDILVNNSGVRRDGVVAMLAREDWERVLRINLDGCFHMSKFAVKLMMRRRSGRIIMITSPMAHVGFAGQANYAASKAGQQGMMRSLSKEVATRGITVNCISPGFIETNLIEDLNDKQREEYRAMVPMKRFGQTFEVAEGVLFLASEAANYITGTTLEISGGL